MSAKASTILEMCVAFPPACFSKVTSPLSLLQMFEKFSIRDVDSGGLGGEYTVQAGFGWTNGVALWVANNFGGKLVAPTCPDPLVEASIVGSSGSSSGSSSKGKNGVLKLSVAPGVLFGPVLLAALQLLVV